MLDIRCYNVLHIDCYNVLHIGCCRVSHGGCLHTNAWSPFGECLHTNVWFPYSSSYIRAAAAIFLHCSSTVLLCIAASLRVAARRCASLRGCVAPMYCSALPHGASSLVIGNRGIQVGDLIDVPSISINHFVWLAPEQGKYNSNCCGWFLIPIALRCFVEKNASVWKCDF